MKGGGRHRGVEAHVHGTKEAVERCNQGSLSTLSPAWGFGSVNVTPWLLQRLPSRFVGRYWKPQAARTLSWVVGLGGHRS